eukprot:TRINITY_DN65549_c9_g7_i2.p1 TRINITY_DN65549_c9_g7~~TRINITY_DN65549_c9_g7_i2.p1  ORF type:complete len:766 (+),score=427.80 TRINITY_DN65549_c9_g7_i2:238-2298(+)
MAAQALQGLRRWACTGTPLQNKVGDAYALMRFLQVEPFDKYPWWSKYIMTPLRQRNVAGLERLQKLLGMLTLRRRKTDTLHGHKLVKMAGKAERVRLVAHAGLEELVYKYLSLVARKEIRGGIGVDRVLQLILRLRQACNHASLLPDEIVRESERVPKSSLTELRRNPQLLQHYNQARIIEHLDNESCSKCRAPVDLREGVLLPCRHFVHLLCVAQPVWAETNKQRVVFDCPVDRCNKTYHFADLVFGHDMVQQFPPDHPSRVRYEWSADATANGDGDSSSNSSSSSGKKGAEEVGKSKATKTKFRTPVLHNDDLRRPLKTSVHGLRYSQKLLSILDELQRAEEEDANYKVVIFSQWTSMLNLCQTVLSEQDYRCTRLDGSMSREQRREALRLFREDPGVKIFLISLKAGGTGLNLNSANKVFMVDPWWNPMAEDQAVDRVHRLGQMRDVEIVKFIVQDSVEENMVELQLKKREMISNAMKATGKRPKKKSKKSNIDRLLRVMRFSITGIVRKEHDSEKRCIAVAKRQLAVRASRLKLGPQAVMNQVRDAVRNSLVRARMVMQQRELSKQRAEEEMRRRVFLEQQRHRMMLEQQRRVHRAQQQQQRQVEFAKAVKKKKKKKNKTKMVKKDDVAGTKIGGANSEAKIATKSETKPSKNETKPSKNETKPSKNETKPTTTTSNAKSEQ